MTCWIGLLRAVNVGGTGKMPMADLVRLCEEAGFQNVRTYIASGNVLFSGPETEAAAKHALEPRLEAYAGRPITVFVRAAAALKAVLAENPFADEDPKKTVAIFLDTQPTEADLAQATGVRGERMHLGRRVLYAHYPDGMGRSKLVIPAAQAGTARNMNTVAKLVSLAARG